MSRSRLRIAISGSAGLGKTTLSMYLAEALSVPHSPDNVRETLVEMGFQTHRGMDLTTVAELCRRVVDKRIVFESNAEEFVADTSTADNANFWLRRVAPEVDARATAVFVDRCRVHAASQYSAVVLLPFGALDFVDDGVRNPNMQYQGEMHAGIRELLLSWPIPFYEMPPEVRALAERARWVGSRVGALPAGGNERRKETQT